MKRSLYKKLQESEETSTDLRVVMWWIVNRDFTLRKIVNNENGNSGKNDWRCWFLILLSINGVAWIIHGHVKKMWRQAGQNLCPLLRISLSLPRNKPNGITTIQLLPFEPLRTNPTKWSNTLKQFVGYLPTNCFSMLDHFVKLALKGLIWMLFWRNSSSLINKVHKMPLWKINNDKDDFFETFPENHKELPFRELIFLTMTEAVTRFVPWKGTLKNFAKEQENTSARVIF